MKYTSIRELRSLFSRSFALLAIALLIVAFNSPEVINQVSVQQSVNNSPLGIACVVDHALTALLN